jgi:hypothetical protein
MKSSHKQLLFLTQVVKNTLFVIGFRVFASAPEHLKRSRPVHDLHTAPNRLRTQALQYGSHASSVPNSQHSPTIHSGHSRYGTRRPRSEFRRTSNDSRTLAPSTAEAARPQLLRRPSPRIRLRIEDRCLASLRRYTLDRSMNIGGRQKSFIGNGNLRFWPTENVGGVPSAANSNAENPGMNLGTESCSRTEESRGVRPNDYRNFSFTFHHRSNQAMLDLTIHPSTNPEDF